MRVDADTFGIRFDADGFQADVCDARSASRRDEQPIAVQAATVVELQDVAITLATRRGRVDAERKLDAVSAQSFAETFTQPHWLTRQYMSGTADEYDFGAKSAHCLRHLHSDRPGSEHDQPARHGLHAGGFAIGPDSFEA